MSSALPVLAGKEARRVIAAAALMASDKDGEVLAAVRATCRLLAPHNIGPADVFRAALERAVPPPQAAYSTSPSGGWPMTWKQKARWAGLCPALTEWERDFLASIVEQRTLSEKQRDRLGAILAKAERSRS